MKRQKICYLTNISVGVVLTVCLSACGVSTSTTPQEDIFTTLDEYILAGNELPIGQIEQLSVPMQLNYLASSLFDISWDATSTDPYHVTIFISSDPSTVLDDTNPTDPDQVFLQMDCGSDTTQYSCNALGDLKCSFRYEPDYIYKTDPFTGEYVLDADGNRVHLTNIDGSYQITAHHYYLGCGNGPGTVRQAEITTRVLIAGFPATAIDNYIVMEVCDNVRNNCSSAIKQMHIYDSLP